MQDNSKRQQLGFEEIMALFLLFFCIALLGLFLMIYLHWGFQ
jgi:hypothetical protein